MAGAAAATSSPMPASGLQNGQSTADASAAKMAPLHAQSQVERQAQQPAPAGGGAAGNGMGQMPPPRPRQQAAAAVLEGLNAISDPLQEGQHQPEVEGTGPVQGSLLRSPIAPHVGQGTSQQQQGMAAGSGSPAAGSAAAQLQKLRQRLEVLERQPGTGQQGASPATGKAARWLPPQL
jgi:hypothetical protein